MTEQSIKEFDLAIKRSKYNRRHYIDNKESITEKSLKWYYDHRDLVRSRVLSQKTKEYRKHYSSKEGKIERMQIS